VAHPDRKVFSREPALSNSIFQPGDFVIYTVSKQGLRPGPRAREIQPVPNGEDYTYVVDKFWMVQQLAEGDRLIIITRRGKTREVSSADPLLRKASWWQKLRFRDRFPAPDLLVAQNGERR
jgi:hypothetical protein